MRIVKTKRGTYEVMTDINGNGIAVNINDYNDYVTLTKASEDLADSEVIAIINSFCEY